MSEPFDVIVVGAGGSGLAAACSAAEHGGRVLVLEKRPQSGGTTGIAVGSFTAARTGMQQSTGIQDNVADHAEDAGKFAPPDIESKNNSEMRRFFLGEASATLDWLRDLGISFVGPNPEPPNRVPRMHNVVPGAKAYIASLQLALQKAGGKLVCNASVDRLLRDGVRVTGVQAIVDGQLREFHARRGVILAAGDYANSPDIIAQHKGEQFRSIEGINPFATGEGHQLASDAGAKLMNMDVTYGPELRFVPSSKRPFQQWLPSSGIAARLAGWIARWLPNCVMRAFIKRLLVTWQHPEDSLFQDGAILINQNGERFVDERMWPDREIGVANQPDKVAYILLDSRLIQRYSKWPHFISTAPDIAYAYVQDYRRLRADVTSLAETLEELAARKNFAVDTLRSAVASDEVQLEDGPWVLLGPVKAYFTTTEGGAAIDERLRVLDESGDVIPGLFAVGQNGLGGMILWGHGLHIAWAITSGRLAGEFVME